MEHRYLLLDRVSLRSVASLLPRCANAIFVVANAMVPLLDHRIPYPGEGSVGWRLPLPRHQNFLK